MKLKGLLTFILALFVITSSNVFAEKAKTLVFSAIPDQDETRLKERFGGMADYLSEKLEVPVKYIPVKSYAAVITAFRNNQVQLAWFGGLSGVQARLKVNGSQAIAQGVEDTKFRTYIIANYKTGLKKSDEFPKEIAGKTFTFGSKGSTSGRLMPQFYIEKAMKEDVNKVFKRVGFSGNHSKTIALVQTGAYEVGAVNYKVWEKELKEGKIDTSKVSVIWSTPPFQDYQWTIRGDADKVWGEGFTDKVKAALLDLKDKNLLDKFPRSAFIEAKNSDYQPILDTAKSIGIID